MDVKINRAVLLKPDGTREVLRPKITVKDKEAYRKELGRLAGAIKVLLDTEEVEEVQEKNN